MKFISKEVFAKLLAASLVLSVTACASKGSSENDDDNTDYNSNGSQVSTQGFDDGDVSSEMNTNGSSTLANMDDSMSDAQALKQTEFKFAFDRFSVSAADAKVLKVHGKYLAKMSIARVRVEGHTDEKGTREYNLALGERRAKAVEQILLSAGASKSQIEVITFGEESPKVSGSSDNADSANRRVELEYTVGRP